MVGPRCGPCARESFRFPGRSWVSSLIFRSSTVWKDLPLAATWSQRYSPTRKRRQCRNHRGDDYTREVLIRRFRHGAGSEIIFFSFFPDLPAQHPVAALTAGGLKDERLWTAPPINRGTLCLHNCRLQPANPVGSRRLFQEVNVPTRPVRSSAHDWWRRCHLRGVRSQLRRTATATASVTWPGSRARLPYRAELGIDAIWFAPWYPPRPWRDGRYDVADYRAIEAAVGKPGRGGEADHPRRTTLVMQIIIDVVPNHGSDQQARVRPGAGRPARLGRAVPLHYPAPARAPRGRAPA